MVNLLLIGIGLFLFSCDSGGDEDNTFEKKQPSSLSVTSDPSASA